MNIFYSILDYINIIFIAFTMLPTFVQVLYMIVAFFVKKTTFQESEKKEKIAVLIPCRNEEKVLHNLLKDLQNQEYPKDKYDIIVICHNCTDNSKNIALQYGVKVFECNTKEKLKGKALELAINEYMNDKYDYAFYSIIDADCRIDKMYLSKINDAYCSGVDVARTYLGSTNTFSNSLSCVGALYSIRDGRITARVRQKLKMNVQLIGNSFFMSRKLLNDLGGFPSSNSLTEDADFMVRCMLKKYRIQYVEDAICYTEESTKVSELFKRNMRLGSGINKIFWLDGYKLLGKFFTTFKFTYLDIFLTLAFLPISIISCVWFPIYYVFLILKMIITDSSVLHMTMQMDMQTFVPMAILVVCIMLFMMSLQGVIAILLQKDRLLNNIKFSRYTKGILMMAPIMLLTNFAITCGILNIKQSWKAIKRSNTDKVDTDLSLNNESLDTTCEDNNLSSEDNIK